MVSASFVRVAGIDVRIHFTFPLILVLGALQWSGNHGPRGAVFGAMLMALLFTCVALHELGHSLVARAFGVPVKRITLLPIGGIAQLEKKPPSAFAELMIALAGPAVNVVLAAGLYFLRVVAPGSALGVEVATGEVLSRTAEPSVAVAIVWLLSANVALAIFNMIPALPMDGGRVLRALLAMMMGQRKATRVAAVVAQVLALAMGIWGFTSGNLILGIIAIFVFMGAGQEQMETTASSVLASLRVGDAYNKYALTLTHGDHVSKVIEYILQSYQPDYAVLHGDQLMGVVTRDDVLRALSTDTRDLYVSAVMQRDVLRVSADQSLDDVRQKLMQEGKRLCAVFEGRDDAHYLGLVSLEDIQEALLVASFAERQREMRVRTA